MVYTMVYPKLNGTKCSISPKLQVNGTNYSMSPKPNGTNREENLCTFTQLKCVSYICY